MEKLNNFFKRHNLSIQMQPIAIEKIYKRLWPGATIHQTDIKNDQLSKSFDRIGNTDKTIITPQAIIQISQRIRQSKYWLNGRFRDFTLREAEYNRMTAAMDAGGMLPNYYAYGYATDTFDDFLRFFVIRFPDWFEYIHRSMIPPQHRLRFKKNNGGQENFYWIPWNFIPVEFVVTRYVLGITTDIQPIGKKQGVVIQLSLWANE